MTHCSPEDLGRITDYLSGTLSVTEMAETERWIVEDDVRRSVMQDLRRSRSTLAQMRDSYFSVDELVSGVKTKIQTQSARSTLSLVQQTGEHAATSRELSQRPVKSGSMRWLRGAALAVALIAGAYGTMRWTVPQDRTESVRTTGRGERATIQLADGTKVILGAQSKLRYAYPFGDNNRNVYLEGEAYFTVTNHTKTPFIVHTAHAATQVLGTEFLVRAHSSEPDVQIVVKTGKVVLRPASAAIGSGTVLGAGELGRITAKGLMTVTRDVAVDAHVSWTQGELVFMQARLSDMIPEIERWFDVKVILTDSALASTRITHTLDTESVDQMLEQLAVMSNLSWTRIGNTVTVSVKTQ